MASELTPAAASARPAAPSRSWAMAISRCSVETYSSLKRSASRSARSSVGRSRSPRYCPLPPRTFGILPSSASSCCRTVSARAPSLASTGPTTPSRCWSSATSRCSGSRAWWPCWSASPWAACSGSCALTVSLSNRIACLSLRVSAARRFAAERFQSFVELFLVGLQVRGHHDAHGDELVAGAAALDARHAIARQPEGAPARGRRRHLHRDFPAQRGDFERGAQRGFGRRDGQRQHDVVALALEVAVRRHGDGEVEIAAVLGTAAALAGHAHALAAAHAGRDLHVDVAPGALPAAAAARRARLAADVARAAARRAGLLHLELECLARAAVRFLERDRHVGLDVVTARAAAEPAGEILEPAAAEPRRAAAARGGVAED